MPTARIRPSDKQAEFITSDATITWLIGPQGEGKTFAGVLKMIQHRSIHPNNFTMRGIIVRDSHENIKRMTIPSIKEALQKIGYKEDKNTWSDSMKHLSLPGIEIDLLGIADLGALGKIHGGEYAFIWLEEPAPIVDKGNSGLPEEVFDTALSRCGRQPGSIGCMIITMNPADEDHWTYHKAIDDPINPVDQKSLTYPELVGDDGKPICTKVINIPYGENQNLPAMSRAATKAAYKNRPDLWQRYVEGEWAFVQLGEKVTPEYNDQLHRKPIRFDPIKNLPVIRLWDGGHNPTCVFCQETSRGYFRVLDSRVGDNTGMRQFIKTQVKPLMASRYSGITQWQDIGDPNLAVFDQSDAEITGSRIIEDELDTTFEKGPDRWEPRREAIKEMLVRLIDGEPQLQISAHEGYLHRALRGGWHYKKDNAGNIIRDKPVKNMSSHPGDALSYGIAVLHPWKSQKIPQRNHKRTKQRANSYSVRGRRSNVEIKKIPQEQRNRGKKRNKELPSRGIR